MIMMKWSNGKLVDKVIVIKFELGARNFNRLQDGLYLERRW